MKRKCRAREQPGFQLAIADQLLCISRLTVMYTLTNNHQLDIFPFLSAHDCTQAHPKPFPACHWLMDQSLHPLTLYVSTVIYSMSLVYSSKVSGVCSPLYTSQLCSQNTTLFLMQMCTSHLSVKTVLCVLCVCIICNFAHYTY